MQPATTHTTVPESDNVATPPRSASPGLASGPWVILAVALAAALVMAVLLFDQVGPTIQRSATVTSTHRVRVHGRHGTHMEYRVDGRDDHGGTFEVLVGESDFRHIDVGDTFTVGRAVLTGRVVEVTGTDWSLLNSILRIVLCAVGLLVASTVLAFMAWLLLQAERREIDRATRWRYLVLVIVVVAVALGGVGIWVAAKRSESNIGTAGSTADRTEIVAAA